MSVGGTGLGLTKDDSMIYGNDCRQTVQQLLSSKAMGRRQHRLCSVEGTDLLG